LNEAGQTVRVVTSPAAAAWVAETTISPASGNQRGSLVAAGIGLVDPRTGADSPTPVTSGTGDTFVSNFEPNWIVAQLKQLHQSR